MKGYHFVTIAALLLSVGSVAYSAGRSAQAVAATPQQVQVTNTTSQPIPTSIYHSIDLPAVQAGAWNVGQAADKSPFTRFEQLDIAPGMQQIADYFQVPAGKRLIIDSFSARCIAGVSGNWATVGFIQVVQSGVGVRDEAFMPMNLGDFPGGPSATISTHLIAEPGDYVYVYFRRGPTHTSLGASIDGSFQGYYVPVP